MPPKKVAPMFGTANNYQPNFKHKISGSLYIRQLKCTLKVNEKSISLHLFYLFFIVIIQRDTSVNCSNPILVGFCAAFNTDFEKLCDCLL